MLALIGLPAYSSKAYGHVNEHAVVGLARELTQQSLASSLASGGKGPGHLIASYHSDQPADDDPRLAALLAASGTRNPRPNVVLIVLESVGR